MPDIATIARANALSLEVKKDGLFQRQSGDWVLRFTLQSADMPEAITKAPMGQRFACVLVAIDDDETPKEVVPNKRDDRRSKSSTENKTPPASDIAKPARARTPVAAEKRLAQQAGICCADPVFWKFLTEIRDQDGFPDGPVVSEEGAANFVRMFCSIDSRSEIIPGSRAATDWNSLHTQFLGWRDFDISISPADRTDEKALAGVGRGREG